MLKRPKADTGVESHAIDRSPKIIQAIVKSPA
jgi:hypothetical protein